MQTNLFRLSLRNLNTRQRSRNYTTQARHCLSRQFLPLTKESTLAFTENASASHAYLLQAGFIRQSSAGIYTLLPLGLRTIEKMERIIEEEMDGIGGQKLMLPMLLQSDHWKETGRWDTSKGEFFRLKDRKGIDMLLAPTHEEEITSLVASELRSSKQLPLLLYQIGRKYRDELRPRAGLLRGREFIMKDLYSFDKSVDDAFTTYDQVGQAYTRIFQRIGAPFVVAEADSGNIGGSKSHEYHLISPVGEDTLLTCKGCGYTANEELAEGTYNNTHHVESTSTNDHEKVLQVLGLRTSFTDQIKMATLSYSAQDTSKEGNKIQGSLTIITPSQRSANLLKVHSTLGKYLEANNIIHDRATLEFTTVSTEQWLTNNKDIERNPVHVFLDDAVVKATDLSSSPSLIVHEPRHFRLAAASDGCQHCDHGALESTKAIEVAHTFYLGTKYSSTLGCTFLHNGRPTPAEMGCYGIGISRLLASVAESRTDNRGLVWPSSIAPYKLCLITTDDKREAFKSLATQLYDQINDSHTWKNSVVLDDRRTGFGRKMTDAEMVGYPWIVVVGRKAVNEENPMVEIHQRRLNEPNLKIDMPLDALGQWLADEQHSPSNLK